MIVLLPQSHAGPVKCKDWTGPGPFVLIRILTTESRHFCLPVLLSVRQC